MSCQLNSFRKDGITCGHIRVSMALDDVSIDADVWIDGEPLLPKLQEQYRTPAGNNR